MLKLSCFSALMFIGMSWACSGLAEEEDLAPVDKSTSKPSWEVGVALGGQYLADYRGSEQYNSRVIPVPFFIYRGDKLKVDRGGVRGDLLASDKWEVNLSAEVSLSGGQDENSLRQGMPELDSSFELGPSLNIALDGELQDSVWMLRLPLRPVFVAGSNGIEYIGYLFNPKLTYTFDQGNHGWRFSSSIGFSYGSESYHDYYYQVDQDFVTENRAFFDAKAGYSGSYLKSSLIRRSDRWRAGISLRYDNLSGTDYAGSGNASGSPLVETKDYFSLSFFVAKFLWASNY